MSTNFFEQQDEARGNRRQAHRANDTGAADHIRLPLLTGAEVVADAYRYRLG